MLAFSGLPFAWLLKLRLHVFALCVAQCSFAAPGNDTSLLAENINHPEGVPEYICKNH